MAKTMFVCRYVDVFERAVDGSETLDPCESCTGEIVRVAGYYIPLIVADDYFKTHMEVT